MKDNTAIPTFRNTYSVISKTFLTAVSLSLLLFVTAAFGVAFELLDNDSSDFWSQHRWIFLFLLTGGYTAVAYFTFKLIAEEPFYTHIIIDSEGITYFNKYRFRPIKAIQWSQLVANPNRSEEMDVVKESEWNGNLVFWTNENGQSLKWEENFAGYGYGFLPFLYKNRKSLKQAFLTGICQFRKDLQIDPQLLEKIAVNR